MTEIPILETERLRIRPPEISDLQDIHQVYLDGGWVDGDLAPALEERREWLEWAVRNHRALASLYQPPYGDRVVTLRSGAFVGIVGLVPALAPFGLLPYFRARLDNLDHAGLSFPEVGLFWAALKSQRGHGYITEAARTLIDFMFAQNNLRRIIAQTDHNNLASQAVMRRLDMTIESNPNQDPHYLQVVGVLENPGLTAKENELTKENHSE